MSGRNRNQNQKQQQTMAGAWQDSEAAEAARWRQFVYVVSRMSATCAHEDKFVRLMFAVYFNTRRGLGEPWAPDQGWLAFTLDPIGPRGSRSTILRIIADARGAGILRVIATERCGQPVGNTYQIDWAGIYAVCGMPLPESLHFLSVGRPSADHEPQPTQDQPTPAQSVSHQPGTPSHPWDTPSHPWDTPSHPWDTPEGPSLNGMGSQRAGAPARAPDVCFVCSSSSSKFNYNTLPNTQRREALRAVSIAARVVKDLLLGAVEEFCDDGAVRITWPAGRVPAPWTVPRDDRLFLAILGAAVVFLGAEHREWIHGAARKTAREVVRKTRVACLIGILRNTAAEFAEVCPEGTDPQQVLATLKRQFRRIAWDACAQPWRAPAETTREAAV